MEINIEGFNKLHVSIKAGVAGLLLVMPIWFFDIYLFYKDFFQKDLYIVIIASYCLTVALLIANLFIAQPLLSKNIIQVNGKETPHASFTLCVLLSVMGLFFWSSIAYIFKINLILMVKIIFGTMFIFYFLFNSKLFKGKPQNN